MFEKGTDWIRADFHLHTNADKEFKYTGEVNEYVSEYIDALVNQSIKLGVITNHNKFDLPGFKALKRNAKKNGIILHPGVELSVKEGSNGIHCLIVLNGEEWISGGNEHINQFLDEVFKGIPNRENENTRCNKDLLGTIECLKSFHKKFFILMAHVEQRSGFFEECDGGLITSLSANALFKENVLGFQKGRTYDQKTLVSRWMGYDLPYIEGSDCKSIEQIGKGNKSFLKIGDDSFDSLILAFKDYGNRLSLKEHSTSHGFVKSVKFVGGKLDSKEINLSPELNCLIGIRGSGKSSIIEAVRYALDLSVSESDAAYKTEVVKNLLGSGGQIFLTIQDDFKNEYTIKRTWNEKPHIINSIGEDIGVKIDTILKSPLYFGQKDLSSTEEGFELELLDKLVGEKISESKSKLNETNLKLVNSLRELLNIEKTISSIPDLESDLTDIKHKITIFEEKGVADKLSKQVVCQDDLKHFHKAEGLTSKYSEELTSLISLSELVQIRNLQNSSSEESPELFQQLEDIICNLMKTITELEELRNQVEKYNGDISLLKSKMENKINNLEEEFAQIKREINIPNLDPDEYGLFKNKEKTITEKIEDTKHKVKSKEIILQAIRTLSDKKNEILLGEFRAYKKEIDKINISQSSLQISIEFKSNKTIYIKKLSEMLRGTGLKKDSYVKISEEFSDFTALVLDILTENSKRLAGLITDAQLTKIKENVINSYSEYISIETPNLIEIQYHGKSLIKHSIGQRASALVLFILTQKENNLILIDQPEDDLDNQVIYKEIISEIKNRKPDVQFIFATHNANIPVLGDAEQIVSVEYNETAIDISSGSIDNKDIQNKIVDIMEGGPAAFKKRKEIYNLWN